MNTTIIPGTRLPETRLSETRHPVHPASRANGCHPPGTAGVHACKKSGRSVPVRLTAVALTACMLGGACSTHKVPEEKIASPVLENTAARSSGSTNKVARPPVIYVSDFYLEPSEIQQAQGPIAAPSGVGSRVRRRIDDLRGRDPASRARELTALLSETIVKELNKAGEHAERLPNQTGFRKDFYPADTVLPDVGWLVSGWFVRVKENEPAVEATVGFGHGSGEVEIQVVVFDLAHNPREPFLFMGTESGRQHRPGGLVTMNPYAMAAKFVLARGATEKDVRKQGAEIAGNLIRYIQKNSH